MTDAEYDLPDKWCVQPSENSDEQNVEFHYKPGTGTRFIVRVVVEESDRRPYKLRLSTVTRTNVRHDYYVEAYDTRSEAIAAAELFTEYLTANLRQGSLSTSDPDIESVQDTIDAFVDDSSPDVLVQILRHIRSRYGLLS
ncbi:hypothetical protein [Halospeciosus flavus]|uniref:Uncharacterized protein n=1 Tax=Halospeciosus flavus TaxID=3032283 RepID=A0ABD5YYG7_9EURY|nr:hypothetical protein [Halospeciosus flavus]